MFFSSVFVPSSSLPTGRIETLASQRSEPSSMFTSQTPSWRSVSRRSVSHSRACAAERTSGSVTISTSGMPPRLKSTTDRRRRGCARSRRRARSCRRPPPCGRGGCARPPRRPPPADRDVVLARSGSPSAGPDRSSSCGAKIERGAISQPSASPIAARSRSPRALSDRQRARQPEADGTGVRVGRVAEAQLAAAEHLRARC